MHDWFEELPGAVTICDRDFTVVYMNEKSRATFAESGGDLLGKNLLDCHKPASREAIRKMVAEGRTNVYTIRKKGVKKLIWQGPWKKDGKVAGLVEISLEIPEDLPHFDRDKS